MTTEDWNYRKKIAKDRLTICNECPRYVFTTTKCKECGCIMLAKTMFAFTECPLGKWGKDDIASANT